ncbi:MAG: 2,3-bisphosphoglycerate-independent phosphoglycerate mutase [Candidatus Buchananbacteria bacterium]|nr:2,3-bisphosphoglycerate-independent phosphoglycerate mutase [Candidatus Buchananbacteria bacterium]
MTVTNKIKNIKVPTVVLLVLDGWGISKPSPANAIELAKKPNFDHLWKVFSHSELHASGRYVGLPDNQPGNSEAGHMNIGAGRIVEQDPVLINKEINSGRFFKNPAFEAAYDHAKKFKSDLHIMGMLGDGKSAHADPEHLLALIIWARIKKIKNVYLHLFTDGRDSPPHSALKLVEALMRNLKNKEIDKHHRTGEWIATITGRFYAMDRKKAWDRTEATYNALVLGKANYAKSPQEAITQAYNRGESDEFIPPYAIKRNSKPIVTIKDNDAVIFFNLRSDRARQLAKPFVQKNFEDYNGGTFKRKKVLKNLCFVALTDFGPDLDSILTAYPSVDIKETLPIALKNYHQLYIAEKEKYAHATYFINGGYPDPVAGEERLVLPSPNVSSYDQKPEMSVYQTTAALIKELPKKDFIFINFANADMVGHTGNIKAAIKAVEACDECIGKINQAVKKKKGIFIITADHGNADKMLDLKTGEKYTEHTGVLVPFIVADYYDTKKIKLKKRGKLADIAPTILKLMGVKKPKLMTGKELF